MKWDELLAIVSNESLFNPGLLVAGGGSIHDVRRQLSRWVAAGKVIRLRRGLYMLAPPYRKITPHPFLVANQLRRPSYVSLQSALAYHGMIPEQVFSVTSVTTSRPERVNSGTSSFVFKHIKVPLFEGYRSVEVAAGQRAFVASPEKSLLDLVYLTPGAESLAYLRELRLQRLGIVDRERLVGMAAAARSPKLVRAA